MKRDLLLCRIAATLCAGDESELRDSLEKALENNIQPSTLREVILTSYLFDGYPTALEGFRLFDQIVVEYSTESEEFIYTAGNVGLWRSRGIPLCRKIYAEQFDQLTERVKEFAPELADAMIVEGYGKVLSRPQLDIATRELCIVTMLAVKDKPRQLMSHALGALRVGASPTRVLGILEVVKDKLTTGRLQKVHEILSVAISKTQQS